MAVHALNARIYADLTAAGTQAIGTSTLTLLSNENSWSFDRTRDFVDGTVFGASSKTGLPGLPNASGDISGFWGGGGAGTLLYIPGSSSVERALMIFPDFTNTPSSYISGKAFFSDKAAGSTTSAVSFDFHFEAGPSGITWT